MSDSNHFFDTFNTCWNLHASTVQDCVKLTRQCIQDEKDKQIFEHIIQRCGTRQSDCYVGAMFAFKTIKNMNN
jgi:hypothetical protein